MTAADLYQALTATGQYIVALGRKRHEHPDEDDLHGVIIDGTFDLHDLAAALMPEPLAPEGVRALIAEAETHLANVHNCSILKDSHDDLIERLAATLSASLPREDADLDAILARLVEPEEVPCSVCDGTGAAPDLSDCPFCLGTCCMGTDTAEAMQQTIRGLVARVRTAEAERDVQAKQREHWATENDSLWSWILALGALAKKGGFQDGGLGWQTYISRAVHAAVEDRASRTVETAEKWEYGVRLSSEVYPETETSARRLESEGNGQAFRRTTPGPWEPVPPTPEEADDDEVRRLAAKIIDREKPLLDRLAAHDGPEGVDRA